MTLSIMSAWSCRARPGNAQLARLWAGARTLRLADAPTMCTPSLLRASSWASACPSSEHLSSVVSEDHSSSQQLSHKVMRLPMISMLHVH